MAPDIGVIVRTLRHPAAAELSERRAVVTCDDLYEAADFEANDFESVYRAIAERVVESARVRPTIYAVPGSTTTGELAVAMILGKAAEIGLPARVVPSESFIEAVLGAVGYDPLDRGLQILNGHRLPEPLVIDQPSIVAHIDLPVVLADVASRLGRVMPETKVTIVIDAGGKQQKLVTTMLDSIDPRLAGPRTSLFIDAEPGGLIGAVRTMLALREQCPWDRSQTHQSLVKNLVEETYELVEAIAHLPADGALDFGALAEVEDELGDVLLQVLFHCVIARQAGAFDLDDVAENLRQKLVRRHPHVFHPETLGDVKASTAEEVKDNWDRIKREERGDHLSALDGVPAGMPALHRAAKVQRKAAKAGFDWPSAPPVLAKLAEEVAEVAEVLDDRQAAFRELGDVLFSAVNLSRHLEADPELALRAAIDRFEVRFRAMEEMGDMKGLSLEQLDARWDAVKGAER
jgi:tetrapyrrole methylase family protein/MazG family protein